MFPPPAVNRCRIDESSFECVSAVFQGLSRSHCYSVNTEVRVVHQRCRAPFLIQFPYLPTVVGCGIDFPPFVPVIQRGVAEGVFAVHPVLPALNVYNNLGHLLFAQAQPTPYQQGKFCDSSGTVQGERQTNPDQLREADQGHNGNHHIPLLTTAGTLCGDHRFHPRRSRA